MQENNHSTALHRLAIIVALCALGLIAMGGLVTSHGVGMAVPDWPTSYGYNMFALPVSMWLTGGVFHEHTHRLWASIVGVLVVALTRWLGGHKSRLPLAVIGLAEVIAGLLLPLLGANWKGAGYFLSGIGGVVVLAALVWCRNEAGAKPLPVLGWWVFWLVQVQGLLGGLRVVLDAQVFAGIKLGVFFGVIHGCLGQVFLVLLGVIVLLTSRWWAVKAGGMPPASMRTPRSLLVLATGLIFFQLLIGATMRHQHAGLAIRDFPLAHGAWWPDMSATAIESYNSQRVEVSADNPITKFQISLQMAHRAVALTIVIVVLCCVWRILKQTDPGHPMRRIGWGWLGLILIQAGLGAWTIWSDKAADIATLHVVFGALVLVMGTLACVVAFRARVEGSTLMSEQ